MTQIKRPRGHVLFLAFPFPPSRGGGVFRTVATANYLAGHGWEVTVIAPEDDYFYKYQGSEDRSLLGWVSPKIRVERVPLTNWWREDDLRRKSLLSAAAPLRTERLLATAGRYLAPLDHYPFWLIPALRRGLRVHSLRPFDVILATGNPFNSFAAAGVLGRLTDRPYVLDYRDAWTFDQFTGALKAGATDVALAMERRILHGAAGLVCVNDAILSWLIDTHSLPGSVLKRVIENGYDPEFLSSDADRLPQSVPGSHRFAYVGTIIPEKMDWMSVLTAFDRITSQVDGRIRLDIYGHLGFSGPQAAQLQHLFRGHKRIHYHGSVPKATVAGVYANSDVLFLPMYESPYVTSGKVYEMMATGRPILAWGSPTAGAMAPLRGYPKLVFANPSDAASLRRSIEAALALAEHSPPELDEAARQHACRFERGRQIQIFDKFLRVIVPPPDTANQLSGSPAGRHR